MNLTDHSLLCLDLGNTTCRGGIWSGNQIIIEKVIPTDDFILECAKWIKQWKQVKHVAYCSVVPVAEDALLSTLGTFGVIPFALSSLKQSLLPIRYPIPEEIGSDRIANSIAVFLKFELPAIVIDLGTATTFDVISATGGYEGGVIIPGPQGILDYLANQTALLPQIFLPENNDKIDAIGKSTEMAMKSGISHGYQPMIVGIIEKIRLQLFGMGEVLKSVIQTGGEAKNFPIPKALYQSNLTLEGLALAYEDQQV